MAKKLTFTRHNLEGITENKDAVRQQRRVATLFKPGDILPESLWIPANKMLADEACALSFSAKCSYHEAQREVLRRKPYLRLGTAVYMRDREFPGITFVEEEIIDDDAT